MKQPELIKLNKTYKIFFRRCGAKSLDQILRWQRGRRKGLTGYKFGWRCQIWQCWLVKIILPCIGNNEFELACKLMNQPELFQLILKLIKLNKTYKIFFRWCGAKSLDQILRWQRGRRKGFTGYKFGWRCQIWQCWLVKIILPCIGNNEFKLACKLMKQPELIQLILKLIKLNKTYKIFFRWFGAKSMDQILRWHRGRRKGFTGYKIGWRCQIWQCWLVKMILPCIGNIEFKLARKLMKQPELIKLNLKLSKLNKTDKIFFRWCGAKSLDQILRWQRGRRKGLTGYKFGWRCQIWQCWLVKILLLCFWLMNLN